jgi:hypothetical protein
LGPKEWSSVSVVAPELEPPLLEELELEELEELEPPLLDEPELDELNPPLLDELDDELELLEEELPLDPDDDAPLDPLEELLDELDEDEPLELLEDEEPVGLPDESLPPQPDITKITPRTIIEVSKRRMVTPNSSTTRNAWIPREIPALGQSSSTFRLTPRCAGLPRTHACRL